MPKKRNNYNSKAPTSQMQAKKKKQKKNYWKNSKQIFAIEGTTQRCTVSKKDIIFVFRSSSHFNITCSHHIMFHCGISIFLRSGKSNWMNRSKWFKRWTLSLHSFYRMNIFCYTVLKVQSLVAASPILLHWLLVLRVDFFFSFFFRDAMFPLLCAHMTRRSPWPMPNVRQFYLHTFICVARTEQSVCVCAVGLAVLT